MSFGAATMGTRTKRTGARVHDCGRHGLLTARQIATMAKITREGVWQRIRAGIVGEALCMPKHDGLRKVKVKCSRSVVIVAVKLARRFPDRIPTVAEVQQTHPMGARNAMRWRQALTDAQARA